MHSSTLYVACQSQKTDTVQERYLLPTYLVLVYCVAVGLWWENVCFWCICTIDVTLMCNVTLSGLLKRVTRLLCTSVCVCSVVHNEM